MCSILGPWTSTTPNVNSSDGVVAGQVIVNATGAKVPKHRLHPPVPVRARIMWDRDGEEWIDTAALGWTGREVYVQMPDRRYRFTAVWLPAVDLRRR
ncbi:MAG: hypothetical protein ICV70_05215 [Jiangellaceae bacterium]|nr:hypothetical protein [Jiangellaceae bacterium]